MGKWHVSNAMLVCVRSKHVDQYKSVEKSGSDTGTTNTQLMVTQQPSQKYVDGHWQNEDG
jgi:hypothetical protein